MTWENDYLSFITTNEPIRAKLQCLTWDKTTRYTRLSRQPFKKKKFSFNTSCSPLSKAKGTMRKPESWNMTNKTTKGPKASSVQFLYSFSCTSGLCPSSHIPHFFSFTQSNQSLCLYPSPLFCFLTSLSSLSLATHRPHSLDLATCWPI